MIKKKENEKGGKKTYLLAICPSIKLNNFETKYFPFVINTQIFPHFLRGS